MHEDAVIVVNAQDVPIGSASKRDTHLSSAIYGSESLLHRAFSVLLFRPSDGKLLLQQRAHSKITFPHMIANTCCSHPLSCEDEMDMREDMGVRRAARRKLTQELGITPDQVPYERDTWVTRIHYSAQDKNDPTWAEHEIDHVIVMVPPQEPVLDTLNPNEVSRVVWVSPDELRALLADPSAYVAPWFRAMAATLLLDKWWPAILRDIGDGKTPSGPGSRIAAMEDRQTIHRFGDAREFEPKLSAALGCGSEAGAEGAWKRLGLTHPAEQA